MIDKASTVFLSYTDTDGFPVTKAMFTPREREGIRTFWLTTNVSSDKTACFRANPAASLYVLDKRFYRGLSICGTVEVSTDPADKQRIWRNGDERYYPGGVNDPDYCVLKFTAVKARYYSAFKSENFTIE